MRAEIPQAAQVCHGEMSGGMRIDRSRRYGLMYTLRCTHKLLRRIDEAPSSDAVSPSTVLGDWYANLLYLRPQQLVLAVNERTLLSALIPAAPAATVAERLRLEVGGLLRDIGVPAAKLEAELAAMGHVAIGSTASRAVLGCMNDAVKQLEFYPRGAGGALDLRAASLHLAENVYSLTGYARPWVKALELFGVGTGESMTLRPRRWH